MRTLHAALPPLAVLLVTACLAACGPAGSPSDVDLGDRLATEAGCGDACTADSDLVGLQIPLVGRAHDVTGVLRVLDDHTLEVADFGFDGGGLDVRAIVAPDADSLGDESRAHALSEDLRRAGGYDGATLRFPLPDGLTVDDVGAFSIWCVPAGVSFGDAELGG